MYKDLLPIGSVVLLKEGKKRVMICSRVQTRAGSDTIYDYAACLWPEGLIDSSHFYLFNHEDIHYLYHIGLQDMQEFNFRYELEKQYQQIKRDGLI